MQLSEYKRRAFLTITFHDLKAGWARRELWLLLGRREMLSRYRRSYLGSLWVFANMLIVASVLGTLYSMVLKEPIEQFIPYLVAGFTCWNLLSAFALDGCNVFISNAAAIREIPAPLTIYVYKMVWRNLLIFGHNVIILVIVILVFQVPLSASTLLVFPAMLLILLNGVAAGLFLGVLNARHRDIGHFMGNTIRLLFFITPVLWHAEKIGARAAFVSWNPFYYLLDVFRGSLLNHPPSAWVWGGAVLVTVIGWTAALTVYPKYRSNIPLLV